MGFVPQDPFLFSESIMFGKHDGTLEDVIQAGKIADVHKEYEKFKAAYDTVLGERGITLSGGQKQQKCLLQNSDWQSKNVIIGRLFICSGYRNRRNYSR